MRILLAFLTLACSMQAQTILSAVSPTIGPFTVGAGGCLTQNVTVTGAVPTGNTANASPRTFPGNGITWQAFIPANDTVTVKVCNPIAGVIGGSIYDITVQQPGSGGSGVASVTASAPVVSSGGTTPNISCPTCSTATPVTSVAATTPLQSTGGTTPTISCPTCATGTPVTSVAATTPLQSTGGATPTISCPTCATGNPVTTVTASLPLASTGGTTPNISCASCGAVGSGTSYFINASTGNDSNPCSSGSPCLTLAHALSILPTFLSGAYTINVANGTYAEGMDIGNVVCPSFGNPQANSYLQIIGNTATPANVVFTGTITYTPESVSGTETASIHAHSQCNVFISGVRTNPGTTTTFAAIADGQYRLFLANYQANNGTSGLGSFNGSHVVIGDNVSVTGWTKYGTWTALNATLESATATQITLTPATSGTSCLHAEINGSMDMEGSGTIVCPGGSNSVTTFLDGDTSASIFMTMASTSINPSTPANSQVFQAVHGASVFLLGNITATNFTNSCTAHEAGNADQGPGGRTFVSVGGTNVVNTGTCTLF